MRIEDPNEAETVEEGRDELMEEDETDTVVVKKRNKCFLQVRQSQFVLTTCPCFTFAFVSHFQFFNIPPNVIKYRVK